MGMTEENRAWAREALKVLDAVIEEDGPGPKSEAALVTRLTRHKDEPVEAALSELLVGMGMLANLLVLMRKHDSDVSTDETIAELGRIVAPQQ